MNSRVWLVTGSASGLGRNIAEAVLAAGHRLVATARDPRRLEESGLPLPFVSAACCCVSCCHHAGFLTMRPKHLTIEPMPICRLNG